MIPSFPRICPPDGKSGPLTHCINARESRSELSILAMVASMTSRRLCGGMFVAVRVVVAHHFSDRLGRLTETLIGTQSLLVHTEDDATVNWLQSIANVRYRSADNDRHGIVDKRLAHFCAHFNWNNPFAWVAAQ